MLAKQQKYGDRDPSWVLGEIKIIHKSEHLK